MIWNCSDNSFTYVCRGDIDVTESQVFVRNNDYLVCKLWFLNNVQRKIRSSFSLLNFQLVSKIHDKKPPATSGSVSASSVIMALFVCELCCVFYDPATASHLEPHDCVPRGIRRSTKIRTKKRIRQNRNTKAAKTEKGKRVDRFNLEPLPRPVFPIRGI